MTKRETEGRREGEGKERKCGELKVKMNEEFKGAVKEEGELRKKSLGEWKVDDEEGK